MHDLLHEAGTDTSSAQQDSRVSRSQLQVLVRMAEKKAHNSSSPNNMSDLTAQGYCFEGRDGRCA